MYKHGVCMYGVKLPVCMYVCIGCKYFLTNIPQAPETHIKNVVSARVLSGLLGACCEDIRRAGPV